jgi:hypothetical protein
LAFTLLPATYASSDGFRVTVLGVGVGLGDGVPVGKGPPLHSIRSSTRLEAASEELKK